MFKKIRENRSNPRHPCSVPFYHQNQHNYSKIVVQTPHTSSSSFFKSILCFLAVSCNRLITSLERNS